MGTSKDIIRDIGINLWKIINFSSDIFYVTKHPEVLCWYRPHLFKNVYFFRGSFLGVQHRTTLKSS